MVAPSVAEVMEMALLPLFWMVGVAAWAIENVTTGLVKPPRLEMAFTVVGLVTSKGVPYVLLLLVGSACEPSPVL